MEDLEKRIRECLEALRLRLQADGGDLEVVEIKDKLVRLRMCGHCGMCPHAMMTIKGMIESALREYVDPGITVERAE